MAKALGASGRGSAAREAAKVNGAELAGVVLGGLLVAVVLGVLAWSDYRTAHAQATIRRTADQHHRARSGRW